MRDRLEAETKAAMKAQDKARLSALRLISAALQDARHRRRPTRPVPDQDIPAVLQKMIKQRREFDLPIYEQGGRPELAQQEAAEIAVIEEYLPKQMSEAEAKAAIAAAIKEVGRRRPQGHGQGHGRAEGALRRPDGFRQGQRPGEGPAEVGRNSRLRLTQPRRLPRACSKFPACLGRGIGRLRRTQLRPASRIGSIRMCSRSTAPVIRSHALSTVTSWMRSAPGCPSARSWRARWR